MKSAIYLSWLGVSSALLASGPAYAQLPPELKGAQQSASDIATTARINAALDSDRIVSGSRINVSTKGGTVTLRGITPTPQAKAEAINVASHISGVQVVEDGIVVGKIPKAGGDDADGGKE